MGKIEGFSNAMVIFATFTIGGCAWLTPPIQRPVLEDHMNKGTAVGILAITPERRAILIEPYNAGATYSRFCAEPSPDVAQALTATLQASANASASAQIKSAAGDTKSGDADLAAQFAQSLAASNSQLFNRSQGVQLFRDASYALCQAYLNGALKGDEVSAAAAAAAAASAPPKKPESSPPNTTLLKTPDNTASVASTTFDQPNFNISEVNGNFSKLFLLLLQATVHVIDGEKPSIDTQSAMNASTAAVNAQIAAEKAKADAVAAAAIATSMNGQASSTASKTTDVLGQANDAKNQAKKAATDASNSAQDAKKSADDASASATKAKSGS